MYCLTCSDSFIFRFMIFIFRFISTTTTKVPQLDYQPHMKIPSPEMHLFLYPGMKCKGKSDIIIRQPFDTVMLWKAPSSSSIDERAQLHSLHGTSGTIDGHLSDDLLSVGLVVVQKPKLLILPSNRRDDISQLYSIPALEAFPRTT